MRERLNRDEFVCGSAEQRAEILFEMARDRYAFERQLPIHRFFSLTREEMAELLRGRVLDLGCFVGGSTAAHANTYEIDEIWGLDIEEVFLEAARLFVADKPHRFTFVRGFAEDIPLESETFDAILTQDTLEHVVDVKATLGECYRILKPKGRMFCVFPSFYFPWGNHLTMVTRFPWLHLIFSDRHIENAYRSVLEDRGDEAYWYRLDTEFAIARRRFNGVNGGTARSFRTAALEQGFKIVDRPVNGLFSIGRRVERHLWVKLLGLPIGLLARLPFLEEVFLHRVCIVLEKP